MLRADAFTGWAVRKGSPKLQAAILDAYVNYGKKQSVLASRMAHYHKNVKQISNNSGGAELKRFQDTVALFEKYGQQYGFDPLLLAAQGYQESQLRQEARSHVGAIGVWSTYCMLRRLSGKKVHLTPTLSQREGAPLN